MSAPVVYTPNFIADPNMAFEHLWNNLPWERREGAPRRECWMNTFGTSYTYGRGAGERTYAPIPWDKFALVIQMKLLEETGIDYEGCFINGYEGHRDALGWHADDSPEIDATRPIAIVSVGAAREIWFRENGSTDIEKQLLDSGSLLIMGAGMQQTHQHRIPKSSAKCEPRVSLTYRGLVSPT
jgi:alkylated DNA repair dioxygenase AlkB